VKAGLPCSISITRDGFRGVVLNGEVESVSDYPVPSTSRYTAHIKEYATEILIEDPPEAIKAGMSAKVSILADSLNDALLIPLTAVVRKEGRFFCLLKSGDDAMSLREIKLGSSNTTHAVLIDGLNESDEVVINPDSFPELLQAPSESDFASR
jgi:membrane fusion protein (multidrug efflux system)